MANTTLYIPETIKVGFQNRQDTYTKQLGYVIYKDQKNTWRKEGSWQSWRDKNIDPKEFNNEPTKGFVLNKGVKRYETNRSLVRVYDPRGFEFEVTIPNLLWILTEVDCGRKGLEAEFVYAWDGKELVLAPVNSEEYKESMKYTKVQHGKVSAKDYKPGHTYRLADMSKVTYLGRFRYTSWSRDWGYRGNKNHYQSGNKHIFLTEKNKVVLPTSSSVKEEISTVVPDNFAELVEIFTKSKEAAATPKKLIFKEASLPPKPSRYSYIGFVAMLDDKTIGTFRWDGQSVWNATRTEYTYEAKRLIQETQWTVDCSEKGLIFSNKLYTYDNDDLVNENDRYRYYHRNRERVIDPETTFKDGKIKVPYLLFSNGAEEEIKGYYW